MSWEWTSVRALAVGGAVAVVIFAALVANVKPRTTQSLSVASFLLSFGVATMFVNLAVVSGPDSAWTSVFGWAAGTGGILTLVGIVALTIVLPTRLQRSELRSLVVPGIVCLAGSIFLWYNFARGARIPIDGGPGVDLYGFALPTVGMVWMTLVWILAVRFRRAPFGSPVRNEAPILAASLVIYPASNTRFLFADDPFLAPISALNVALVIASGFAWLWAGHAAGSPRTGRNMSWWILATGIFGLVDGLVGGGAISGGIGINGIARLATVAFLSYAVLRHHVLGLDVKVRWGISKTTVAGAFVAVFFIVSEAAQQFYGERLGSEYVGILAAGALVFALAPLSRVADILAAKAVPLTTPAGIDAASYGLATEARDAAYRAATRAAMRDGLLTRREETHLAEVAERLGIGPRRALEIKGEVESEKE